jgi:hypothetical protein
MSVTALRIRIPGSGMGKKSGIWDELPGSYFRELRNNFLGLILKFFDADPGGENFGSGMKKKIRTGDPE